MSWDFLSFLSEEGVLQGLFQQTRRGKGRPVQRSVLHVNVILKCNVSLFTFHFATFCLHLEDSRLQLSLFADCLMQLTQLRLFCSELKLLNLQWACVCLVTETDCKQTNSTVSTQAPTECNKASPLFLVFLSFTGVFHICNQSVIFA